MKAETYEFLILDLDNFGKIFSNFEEKSSYYIQLLKSEKDFLFLAEKDSSNLTLEISVFIENQVLKNILISDLERDVINVTENEIINFLEDYSKDIYFVRLNSKNEIEYFFLDIDIK